jgi:adenylate cyclase
LPTYSTPESLGHHLAEVVKAYHPRGGYDRVLKSAELSRTRSALHQEAVRTAPPAEHPDFADLAAGERRSGSIASFYIDLSNFTARSMFEPAEQLADFTELVLSAYSNAIEDHGGYLLDIRGDGIVAGFGGVNARPDINIPRALRAMVFCLRATRDTLNPELERAGIDPTDVKASGDWGDILAMRLGARINYLGSRMNIAAKLEKFADEFAIVVGNDLAGNLISSLLSPHADSPYKIEYGNETKEYPFFVVNWESASGLSIIPTSFPRTISGGTDAGLLRTIPTGTRLSVTSEGRLVRPLGAASVATVIAPHRFHAGTETATGNPAIAWWNDQPDLLEHERRHVAQTFPGFSFFERAGRIGWRGSLRPWGNREFAVEVVWSRERERIPSVNVLKPQRLGRLEHGRWRRSPHLYDSGNPCVARAVDWATESHNATTVIAWTAHWLGCYEQWVAFRKDWPRIGQD